MQAMALADSGSVPCGKAAGALRARTLGADVPGEVDPPESAPRVAGSAQACPSSPGAAASGLGGSVRPRPRSWAQPRWGRSP